MKKQRISRCELQHQSMLRELEVKRQAAITRWKAGSTWYKQYNQVQPREKQQEPVQSKAVTTDQWGIRRTLDIDLIQHLAVKLRSKLKKKRKSK